jgi:hypothetical protein
MLRLLVFALAFCGLGMGQNIVEPFYKLKPVVQEHSECKSGAKTTLCFYKKLTLPTADILSKEIKPSIAKYIKKANESYKKESLATYLSDIDLDSDELFNGNYEVTESLELFDYNKPVITLMSAYYSYLGGAHGLGGRKFFNYDIEEKKELTLDDLVDFNNTQFRKIAELVYRKSDTFLPNETLLDACWLEDNFYVSQNFAVTKSGFLFHYNPYEIKAYACGMTEFILPYYKIKPFLKRKFLKNIADSQKPTNRIKKEIEIEKGSLNFDIKRVENRKFTVNVDTSIYNNKKVWVSLSFPNLQSAKYISKLHSSDVKDLKLYKIGSKIYSKKIQKVIRSKYPLVEAATKSDQITFTFTLLVPKNISYLCMNYRVTTRTKNLLKYDDYHEFFDQQGFRVNRICFGE